MGHRDAARRDTRYVGVRWHGVAAGRGVHGCCGASGVALHELVNAFGHQQVGEGVLVVSDGGHGSHDSVPLRVVRAGPRLVRR